MEPMSSLIGSFTFLEMVMYKYCLFDLDGTLTDPKEGICKSVQYALHKMGIEEPDIDKLEPFIGPPLPVSFKEFYGMSEEDCTKAVAFYRERFSAVGLYENEMYEGIDEMLDTLKDLGVKLAVASSKPTVFVTKILEHFKLADYFDVVVGSNLDGTRSEKSEVVKEALLGLYFGPEHEGKRLEDCTSQKAETAMIGDRCFDIEGAHAMGIVGIGVEYGYAPKGELKKAGADKLAKNVKVLTEILSGQKTKKEKSQVNVSNNKSKHLPEKTKQSVQDKKTGFLLERNEESMPRTSFQKSLYVLTPFLLYFMVMLAVFLMGKIVIDKIMLSGNQALIDGLQENSWTYSGGLTSLSMLIAVIVLLGIYRKTDRMPIAVNMGLPVSALAGATLAIGLNALVAYICVAIPSLQKYLESSSFNKDMPMLVGLIAFGVISPLAEEVCFRYLMYGRMKRVYGTVFAVIVSSLFFGINHGHWLQSIYAFAMGMCMALCYEWCGSILATILFHMAANIVTYLLAFAPVKIQQTVNAPFACALWIFVGLGSMTLIYKLMKKENNNV